MAKKGVHGSSLLPALTSYTRHFFAVTFLVLIVLSMYVAGPFLSSLFLGLVAAYIFYPAYRFVLKWVKGPRLAAFLLSAFLVIASIIPLVLLADQLAVQTSGVYNKVRTQLRSEDPLGLNCPSDSEGFICGFANRLSELLTNADVRVYITEFLNALSEFAGQAATAAILSLPKLVFQAFVVLLAMYYLFVDGPSLLGRVKSILPFHLRHKERLINQVDDVLYSVIYGSLLIIFLQGISASAVFWLVGVSAPVFWGVAMALLALLPLIGTWIVWVPIGLSLVGAGNVSGDPVMVWKGIAVLAYGLLIAIPLDWIVKPFVMADKGKVHPLLVLVGVLGGLSMFGLVGVFFGPVVLSLLSAFFKIYEEERKYHKEI